MTNTAQQLAENESDISVNDVIHFFVIKWKVFLIGAIGGLILVLGVALLSGKYEAEATLINKPGIDYMTWKNLKRNLPLLAARISEKVENSESFLNVLSNEAWWQRNVVPTFAIAKEDAKEVFGVSKELQDAEAMKIKDFVVKATGASKEEALKNLSVATSFMRGGSAYLALKDIIANYQIELLNSESEIAKKASELEIKLAYLNRRKVDLELLKVKFPANSDSLAHPMDPKDSSAKYLPITTQLIAVHQDISALKEDLSRLNDRKSQLAIFNNFLLQAKPVMDRDFDGLSAVAALMRIESGMRKELQPFDWNRVSILNNIKYDLALIHTRFTLGLEPPTHISARKPSYMKPAIIGLASGFFLAILGAIGSTVWLRYRRETLRRALNQA